MSGKKFKPRLVWEHWKDPLGADMELNEWPGYNSQTIDDEKLGHENYELLTQETNENVEIKSFRQPLQVVFTQMGMVPLTEYTVPSKIFNFWTLHTNFDITSDISGIIEATPGVETLDIFTRYRMRIGFAKVFKAPNVKKKIQSRVLEYFDENAEISSQ